MNQRNHNTKFLPRLKTPENIFIGKGIVTNKNNECFVMAINAYEKNIEIEILEQCLEPYKFDESDDFFPSDYSNTETIDAEETLNQVTNFNDLII